MQNSVKNFFICFHLIWTNQPMQIGWKESPIPTYGAWWVWSCYSGKRGEWYTRSESRCASDYALWSRPSTGLDPRCSRMCRRRKCWPCRCVCRDALPRRTIPHWAPSMSGAAGEHRRTQNHSLWSIAFVSKCQSDSRIMSSSLWVFICIYFILWGSNL